MWDLYGPFNYGESKTIKRCCHTRDVNDVKEHEESEKKGQKLIKLTAILI